MAAASIFAGAIGDRLSSVLRFGGPEACLNMQIRDDHETHGDGVLEAFAHIYVFLHFLHTGIVPLNGELLCVRPGEGIPAFLTRARGVCVDNASLVNIQADPSDCIKPNVRSLGSFIRDVASDPIQEMPFVAIAGE